jgi:hypothetical protein
MPAALDEFLAAANDEQEPVFINVAHVACAQPSIREIVWSGLAGCIRRNHAWTAQKNLALFVA